MPLMKCKRCHHEWEGQREDVCDWCSGESLVLDETTPLERMLSDWTKDDDDD